MNIKTDLWKNDKGIKITIKNITYHFYLNIFLMLYLFYYDFILIGILIGFFNFLNWINIISYNRYIKSKEEKNNDKKTNNQ